MLEKIVQAFEHETLTVGTDLTVREFEALAKYGEHNNYKFFELRSKSIRLRHYVGVLSVGNLTIEVLPKIGKVDNSNIDIIRNALVSILHYTGSITLYSTPETSLLARNQSMLDLYFQMFLDEVDNVLRVGLRKKYRFSIANITGIKGKIKFNQNFQKNFANASKHICSFLNYDLNNPLNIVIKKALRIINQVSSCDHLKNKSHDFLFMMGESIDCDLPLGKINHVHTDRNTLYYEKALKLAKMIITSYAPQLERGKTSVLGFMFNMNELFEKFIAVVAKKSLSNDAFITTQSQSNLWHKNGIRPDIMVKTATKTIAVDTKWKVLNGASPDASDVQQVYTYCHYFHASHGILIYPKCSSVDKDFSDPFLERNENSETETDTLCSVHFIDLIHDGLVDIAHVGEQLKNAFLT